MQKKYKNTKKGFTLIELMVVIAIIGIVMSIILTSFSSEQDKRATKAAAQTILSRIKETQNNALSGKRIDEKRSCLFHVNITSNSIIQTVDAYDPTDAAQSCSAGFDRNVAIARIGYEGGAIVSTPPGVIGFDVPYGTALHTRFSGGSPVLTIPIEKGGSQAVVCVYRSGRVEALMSTHVCPS